MTSFISSRIWMVWLVLVVAALFSWWTAAGRPFDTSTAQLGGAIAVAIGFCKTWLIGKHFMDLCDARPLLHWAFDPWTVLIGGVVVALVLLRRDAQANLLMSGRTGARYRPVAER
ncbi:cytochrome C oxidase subunit IV family protein [Panacagrimonas sp.]|uniref:cytochrome C oxidase subunit IV family protein n=1 Tax=Panacagrimonas sp. TaxID=2480088 RepID=UPI003B528D3E